MLWNRPAPLRKTATSLDLFGMGHGWRMRLETDSYAAMNQCTPYFGSGRQSFALKGSVRGYLERERKEKARKPRRPNCFTRLSRPLAPFVFQMLLAIRSRVQNLAAHPYFGLRLQMTKAVLE